MLKDKRGITLLELMVALVITALLGMAIYNVCKMAMDAWQKGEARTQVYQNMRIALDRMSEEIRSAITLDPTYNLSPNDDIYFDGTSTTLNFISIAHAPIGNYYDSNFATNELVFDCCEIGYRRLGTSILRRKQEKNVPDDNITTGGSEKELVTHITSLGFRYSPDDGTTFYNSWPETKTATDGLPKIVEIGITAESAVKRYPNEKTFSTYVYLSGR